MEDRSSWHLRSQTAHRGPASNEIANARISMMARSMNELQREATYINARPFTQLNEHLFATPGGTIDIGHSRRFCGVCDRSGSPPIADRCADILGRQLSAKSGEGHDSAQGKRSISILKPIPCMIEASYLPEALTSPSVQDPPTCEYGNGKAASQLRRKAS
jgi:hypothetical protein